MFEFLSMFGFSTTSEDLSHSECPGVNPCNGQPESMPGSGIDILGNPLGTCDDMDAMGGLDDSFGSSIDDTMAGVDDDWL